MALCHRPPLLGLAERGCELYAATFEHLFRVLVQPASSVVETDCEACGDAMCRFEVRWRCGA